MSRQNLAKTLSSFLVVCLLSLGSCQAAGTRGAELAQLKLAEVEQHHEFQHLNRLEYEKEVLRRLDHLASHDERQFNLTNSSNFTTLVVETTVDDDNGCNQEIQAEVICPYACDFQRRRGTCESKMWLYQGGLCSVVGTDVAATVSRSVTRSAPTTNANDKNAIKIGDTAAQCHDVGPPLEMGDEVFVVVTDTQDPDKQSSMWTTVGGYFWTDYEDFEIGKGLGDVQNITFYSSNETLSLETMIQTMLFYAPCDMTRLETLDQEQSVTLVGTAVDPMIRADFLLKVQTVSDSSTNRWELTKTTMATNVEPYYHELDLKDNLTFGKGQRLVVPFQLEFNRHDPLQILATITATTTQTVVRSGTMDRECHVSDLYDSSLPVIAAPTSSNNNNNNNNNNESGGTSLENKPHEVDKQTEEDVTPESNP